MSSSSSSSSSSWNLVPKVDDLKFTVPSHIKPLREKMLKFVEEEIYPFEAQRKQQQQQQQHASSSSSSSSPTTQSHGIEQLRKLQRKAKDAGLWAIGHPKEIGGHGLPFRDYIYLNEVQGRSEYAPVVFGTHSLQDSLMLHNHASHEIKEKYLDKLVNAEIYPSFAMTEPDIVSSDPTGIQTKAELVNGEWVINGRKWWTTNAQNAEYTCVMCRTEDKESSLYASFSIILVPTNTPGYTIVRSTHVLGTEGADHSEVVYNNVRVPMGNLIGERGAGFLIAQERLGPGRLFHCMRWLGQAQRAFDLMCHRLVQREVNDKPLGNFQLMQKHVFDSYCDIQAHRLMTIASAEKMDSGDYARVDLAATKANGAQVLCRVMDRAIQVFGAKGLTEDTPLSEMYRLARAARFYDGPDEVHIATVGRLILKEYKHGKRWDFSEGGPVTTPNSKSLSKI